MRGVSQKTDAARERLESKKPLHTVKVGTLAPLAPLAPLGSEAECTAIMIQLADGSFAIKAIVHSDSVTEAALASYYADQLDTQLQGSLT